MGALLRVVLKVSRGFEGEPNGKHNFGAPLFLTSPNHVTVASGHVKHLRIPWKSGAIANVQTNKCGDGHMGALTWLFTERTSTKGSTCED